MNRKDLRPEIIKRLVHDYQFKEQNGYLRSGICPECNKKELFTSIENPWVLRCGRENNCGADLSVKSLYPELFNSWSDRYESTPDQPFAAAEAYLREARGLDTSRLKGCYTQESYHKGGMGSATVRFALSDGIWWERIIDKPERFDRKANFHGKYAGHWWVPPALDLAKVSCIWLTEGIFDAISLYQNGTPAVSIMTAGNYPEAALKALAEQFQGKEKPFLVWALDNGKAGETAIRRHVARSREQGWKAVAALPSQGSNKADWNDLHLTGKLTRRHQKEYRYYGDLLLAESARDKALRMFEHNERPEFHFEYGNCVYWFKLDIERHMKAVERILNDKKVNDEREARSIALKESGAIKEIANCHPAPLYFMRSEVTDESWYYFRIAFPGNTPAVKDSFTAGQISSASEFKKRLLHVAKGALYTGTSQQLDGLIKKDLPRIKEVRTQDFIGYNRDWRAWVFNKLAIHNGKVYSLNSEDYFEIGGMNIKTLSRSPLININSDDNSLSSGWADDIWTAFGENGYVALAFWLGTFFVEQIREQQASFPFLEIIGEPGTGKSTLIDFLWRLCGRDSYEGIDPSKGSVAGIYRNFAQVSNLPVVLLEGDRAQDTKKLRGFDFDELKPLYNGRGLRAIGVKTNNNETREPPFRGSIVIAQNATVNASPAILERIIHVFTDKRRQSSLTRAAAERLERLPVEQVSGFMIRAVCRESAVLSIIQEVYEAEKIRLEQHSEIRHIRIAKNHAQMIACVRALTCVLDIPAERLDRTCEQLTVMAVERVKSLEADIPVVREFWDAFDYLNSLERFGVNHFGKENRDEIAINFPHLMRIAAMQRVNIPPAKEIQDYLKNGRMRPCTGQKTVRSEVSRLANQGRGEAGPKEPEQVKCWIFKVPAAQ